MDAYTLAAAMHSVRSLMTVEKSLTLQDVKRLAFLERRGLRRTSLLLRLHRRGRKLAKDAFTEHITNPPKEQTNAQHHR